MGVFHDFENFTNGFKSCKASHIFDSTNMQHSTNDVHEIAVKLVYTGS